MLEHIITTDKELQQSYILRGLIEQREPWEDIRLVIKRQLDVTARFMWQLLRMTFSQVGTQTSAGLIREKGRKLRSASCWVSVFLLPHQGAHRVSPLPPSCGAVNCVRTSPSHTWHRWALCGGNFPLPLLLPYMNGYKMTVDCSPTVETMCKPPFSRQVQRCSAAHTCNEILFAHRRTWNTDTCYSVNKPCEVLSVRNHL